MSDISSFSWFADDLSDSFNSPTYNNQVRILDDDDFKKIRYICDNNVGWENIYKLKSHFVWIRSMPNSSILMIKVRATMEDVMPSVMYDVLHDNMYRCKWDKYTLIAKEIGLINPNNDISYYAVGSMPPFRARDFVIQRSWLDVGLEKYICSRSVCHEKYPRKKEYIRASICMAAYFIRKLDRGCQLTYVSHCDPKGKLPPWLINRLTKVIAPKMVQKLHRACLKYPLWKSHNEENWKPWLFPEQKANSPRIDLSKCVPTVYNDEIIDECGVNDLKNDDENIDELE